MARQIIYDDDIAGLELGHEHLADVGFEPVAIVRPIEHHWRNNPVRAQPRHQRRCLAVAVREGHPQPFSSGIAAMGACHVVCGPGLVDEHCALGRKVELAIELGSTLSQDIETILVDQMAGPFSA